MKVRKSKPDNEGYQKYYYAFNDNEDKRHTNIIEDLFADIEGNYLDVLNKIHDRINLSNQDRNDLSVFIAFLHTRTPWFRSNIDKMASTHIKNVGFENAKKDFKSSLETMGKLVGVDPKIEDEDYLNLESPRGSIFSLTQVFDGAKNIYQQYLSLR